VVGLVVGLAVLGTAVVAVELADIGRLSVEPRYQSRQARLTPLQLEQAGRLKAQAARVTRALTLCLAQSHQRVVVAVASPLSVVPMVVLVVAVAQMGWAACLVQQAQQVRATTVDLVMMAFQLSVSVAVVVVQVRWVALQHQEAPQPMAVLVVLDYQITSLARLFFMQAVVAVVTIKVAVARFLALLELVVMVVAVMVRQQV
jgi:hypothetical protein